jgi:hypothetical protein
MLQTPHTAAQRAPVNQRPLNDNPTTFPTNHQHSPHTSCTELAGPRPQGSIMAATPASAEGRASSLRRERRVISLRKMTLGSGYRYLMGSVAAGGGRRPRTTSLSAYYAESGTPPGVFLGAGLRSLDAGRGVEKGVGGQRGAPVQHARHVRRSGEWPALGPSAQPCPSVVGQAAGGTDEDGRLLSCGTARRPRMVLPPE